MGQSSHLVLSGEGRRPFVESGQVNVSSTVHISELVASSLPFVVIASPVAGSSPHALQSDDLVAPFLSLYLFTPQFLHEPTLFPPVSSLYVPFEQGEALAAPPKQ